MTPSDFYILARSHPDEARAKLAELAGLKRFEKASRLGIDVSTLRRIEKMLAQPQPKEIP